MPFSPETLQVSGAAVLIAPAGSKMPAAASGTLIHRTQVANRVQPYWVDREGEILGPAGPSFAGLDDIALSPSGSRLALATPEESGDDFWHIWIVDLESVARQRLTFGEEPESNPFWSPDGREIFYALACAGAGRSPWRRSAGA